MWSEWPHRDNGKGDGKRNLHTAHVVQTQSSGFSMFGTESKLGAKSDGFRTPTSLWTNLTVHKDKGAGDFSRAPLVFDHALEGNRAIRRARRAGVGVMPSFRYQWRF